MFTPETNESKGLMHNFDMKVNEWMDERTYGQMNRQNVTVYRGYKKYLPEKTSKFHSPTPTWTYQVNEKDFYLKFCVATGKD